MVNIKILLGFPYTLLDFLILTLCLILFLKYILRAKITRNIIIFLLLRPLKFFSVFFFYKFIYLLFIFGCVGSSLLCAGFL